MKNLSTIIAIITLSIAFSTTATAQVSASAPTSATIVTPISILKNTNMSFGNVAVSSTAGTVVLAPASTRTKTGGVTLPVTTGTVTAAQFTVSGQAGYTYAITLPTTLTITKATTLETMTVDTFTSTPTPTGTLTAGSEVVLVGATLNVSSLQVAGLYENATGFAVTVNYN
ncbi:DUF4402 domain-containing protein [Flavobacterium sp. XS2P39]|uniref:DUF4402 domain-containing protein n=1 Tax=Flavobacterium sp. XS2P39 TaxID=3401725 RepID=UPI003AAAAFF4